MRLEVGGGEVGRVAEPEVELVKLGVRGEEGEEGGLGVGADLDGGGEAAQARQAHVEHAVAAPGGAPKRSPARGSGGS